MDFDIEVPSQGSVQAIRPPHPHLHSGISDKDAGPGEFIMDAAREQRDGKTEDAIRPGARAIARALLGEDRAYYFNRTEAGEKLYFRPARLRARRGKAAAVVPGACGTESGIPSSAMTDVSWADKLSAVSAGLGLLTSGIALWIARVANHAAHQSNRAAEQANATAGSVAQIERDRWQYEMTPRFDVTITRLGPGSNQASLMLTFEGPPALERLDEIEIEIRDDGYTHGVGLAGGPDEQQIAQTIWGPYRFQPGINESSADGRLSPAVPLELGGWLKRALEESFPPSWTDRAYWTDRYAGAPVRLWVRCKREGYQPWTLTYNVEVADPQ